MKILSLGSLNIDKTYQMPHIVEPKETLSALGYQEFCGGKGLNQSVAAARAGAEVYHAGMIGADGKDLVEILKSSGANTDLIEVIDGPSGHAIIQVDTNGQNSILIFGGANQKVSKEYIDSIIPKFEKGDLLLLQNEISNIDYAIEKAYEAGMNVVLNPSPFNEVLDACDYSKVKYFIVNEIEGKQLAGVDVLEPDVIIAALREKYPEACFVLTFGEHGSYYFDKEIVVNQEIFKVKAVDTTGAGDTYCGYFLAGLADGMEVKDILRRSSAASAIAVSGKGAAGAIPVLSQVEEFLKTR